MFKDRINYKLVNLLLISIIIFLAIRTFSWWGGILSKIFDILLPFIISFAIAYALHPIVRKLEQKGVRKGLAKLFVILSVICLIVLVFWITVPVLYEPTAQAIHALALLDPHAILYVPAGHSVLPPVPS